MARLIYFLFFYFYSSICLKAQNQEITRIPFLLNDDHIIIQLRINNSTPLNFMFDSGAGGILINKSFSDSIGLKAASERVNTGAVGTHAVSILKGNTITIGDAQINNVNMMRDDKDFEELNGGVEIAGIIGFHILSRFVVKIDYDTSELIFYNRINFSYEGNGVIVPIVLTYNLPIVISTLVINDDTEIEGFFLVDTGARSYLIITSPTVNKYNMIDKIDDYYVLRTDVGSSGKKANVLFGKIKTLDFAEYKFNSVPTVLSQADEGVLSFEGIDGIIGNKILKRFNIFFDYQRGFIYLEQNGNIDKKLFVNVSGLSIIFKKGVPIIKDIIERSPATRAGLKNGDEIISINGQFVKDMNQDLIREAFKSEEGIKLELVIKRGEAKLKYTEIILKALI